MTWLEVCLPFLNPRQPKSISTVLATFPDVRPRMSDDVGQISAPCGERSIQDSERADHDDLFPTLITMHQAEHTPCPRRQPRCFRLTHGTDVADNRDFAALRKSRQLWTPESTPELQADFAAKRPRPIERCRLAPAASAHHKLLLPTSTQNGTAIAISLASIRHEFQSPPESVARLPPRQ